MFWLLRKLFGLGVLVALVFFALQFQVAGRPIKSYLTDFYSSPLVREVLRQGTEAVRQYLQKDVSSAGAESGPPMDKLSDEEKEELEKVLKKESR